PHASSSGVRMASCDVACGSIRPRANASPASIDPGMNAASTNGSDSPRPPTRGPCAREHRGRRVEPDGERDPGAHASEPLAGAAADLEHARPVGDPLGERALDAGVVAAAVAPVLVAG